jgi:alpha-tubulin suppressor-like RCC1 family protein
MLHTQNLIDKICTRISQGGLTSLESCQTTNALNFLASNTVTTVTTADNLPDVVLHKGRMIYVSSENVYYFSNGDIWSKDFTSTLSAYKNDIWCWGVKSSGFDFGSNTPQPFSKTFFNDTLVKKIFSGATNYFLLKPNNTLWAWGRGCSGQLGIGNDANQQCPVIVAGNFTDWSEVCASNLRASGIRSNGTIWTWGNNDFGELGDNCLQCRSSPVSVVGGITNWCQVAMGDQHAIALRTNGTVWAWGRNGEGQLAQNDVINRSSPVQVGTDTDWCRLSTRGNHNLALKTNGTLWTWGFNTCGQLAQNDVINRSSPVQVGTDTDWCQISASQTHSLALRNNGTLWAWGFNYCGKLGSGNTINTSSPVSVVGGITNWSKVVAGFDHNHAITSSGTLWAWGRNCQFFSSGTLGVCGTSSQCSPVRVNEFTDWTDVAVGCCNSLGLRSSLKGI